MTTRIPLRLPWPAAVLGTLVVALGAAGLIRGAMPPGTGSGGGVSGNSGGPGITVSAAYVLPPVPPNDTAAAYFTLHNTGAQADELDSVTTAAGASAVLHVYVNGQMTVPTGAIPVPARGTLVLSTGAAHVMIQQLYGTLHPGQSVTIQLQLAHAGAVDFSAPVIALGTTPPSATVSIAPSPGGTQ